jgi:hypothetical protein
VACYRVTCTCIFTACVTPVISSYEELHIPVTISFQTRNKYRAVSLLPFAKDVAKCTHAVALSGREAGGGGPAGVSGCERDQSALTVGLFWKCGVCRPYATEKCSVLPAGKYWQFVCGQTAGWRTGHRPKHVAVTEMSVRFIGTYCNTIVVILQLLFYYYSLLYYYNHCFTTTHCCTITTTVVLLQPLL